MKRGENYMKTCMIVNQLQDDYYIGWNQEELKSLEAARNGDATEVCKVINKRLNDAGIPASEIYGIVHDDDWRTVWDEKKLAEIKEKKEPHIHVVVRFYEDTQHKGAILSDVSKALGISANMIEKAKKGRFAYDNMLAYLIHAKDADKTLYEPTKVCSTGLKDGQGYPLYRQYLDIYKARKLDWDIGKAQKAAQDAKMNADKLFQMVLEGMVTRSQVLLTDELYAVYARNSSKINDAFEAYGDRRAYKTLTALERGEFKLSVFFITGEAGAGKTYLAKAFVDALIRTSSDYDDTWRVCHTAASNPMDDYNGEEILFMDDVRGSALTASDWLKLLDPHNASPASARYHNKMPVCRAIVITSTREPIEFFYYCKAMGGGDRSEAMDQFMRRIQCLTRVIKADDFEDTTARIAQSHQGDEYVAAIGEGPCPDKVKLTYSFDEEGEYTIDEAVARMTDIVKDNNDIFTGSTEA